MWQVLVRRWKYLTARTEKRFDEKAEPTVQLEQALAEARDRHRSLQDDATTMIANQKQIEMQLHRTLAELQRLNENARHAVNMAEQANLEDDLDQVSSLTQAAEKFANRIITLEQEVENLKSLHSQVSAAADQARTAVAQSALNLQAKQRERHKLLSQLDHARLQEKMNEAMINFRDSSDTDGPSFDEVRNKIETRFAKAKGMAEITESSSTEASMLSIEAEVRAKDAKTRLNLIKEQLGIGVGSDMTAIGMSSETAERQAITSETSTAKKISADSGADTEKKETSTAENTDTTESG